MLFSLLSENAESWQLLLQVLEMKLTVEGLEKERDFYFGQFKGNKYFQTKSIIQLPLSYVKIAAQAN